MLGNYFYIPLDLLASFVYIRSSLLHKRNKTKTRRHQGGYFRSIWNEPARPGRHAFEWLIIRKLLILEKKVIRHKMFIIFIKLMYQILRLIATIVLDL